MELTFCMIKPDSIKKRCAGAIWTILEKEGFTIVRAHQMNLTSSFCEIFYQEHRKKEFFSNLIDFITSGPVLALALKRKQACSYLRKIMGTTDPKQADKNTIRARFGESIEKNAIHGSDSLSSAQRELALFFPEDLF